jgi:hypothetical protein
VAASQSSGGLNPEPSPPLFLRILTDRRIPGLLTALRGHKAAVMSAAFSGDGAHIVTASPPGSSAAVNLFGRGQPDIRDWASYVGVLPAWSPNLAEWSPISKSRRCQADNETHGYDDRPDPLGRDAETAKQRYIVGSSPM